MLKIKNGNSINGEDEDSSSISLARKIEMLEEMARSINVERPFLLSTQLKLREYQHAGLCWLVSLHERRLNGILADEMGLGKTIQTISLIAYLACFKGIWGPHLIIVPSSCVVNWESEFKRWCPGLKTLTYYGSAKRRKELRTGWSKLNSFHVCITSYQLVVQDSSSFRRKQWYYLILDEAHNIKNFKSQRWQTLLNYNSQRRLLLTGTPLQNNLMELWSLMHFLMPHLFRSRKEFSYWFSNPLTGMVEGNKAINNELISRLHTIMRPFLLRRLKNDVEKQLPGKYEHIVMCKLSKRQLYLYEEFMSRSATRSTLTGGNYLGMMNILMQLRKVCNHPDLFEPRPIISPFVCDSVNYKPPQLTIRALRKDLFFGTIFNDLVHLWFWNFESNGNFNVNCVGKDISNTSSKGLPKIDKQLSFFASYLEGINQKKIEWQASRKNFMNKINKWRCEKPYIHYSFPNCARNLESFVRRVHSSRFNAKLALDITESWYGLVKSVDDVAELMQADVEKFVFVLPKVTSKGISILTVDPDSRAQLIERETKYFKTKPIFDRAIKPFYNAAIRQKLFFPERKLVQFDAGKLQRLDTLLRERKQGGHKCLIFTQMSRMLDILEIFMNIHGHTYCRLDGSTGIEKRQKLMDRFNSDEKLFCFLLSTRSGGLGINLTGADSVIFYDSDWNPAMDAQAQDRAHRIGQTKDVHIYRFVCSSTIEENILFKARQKRHLDHLVMTEGNFSESSLLSSDGLKSIFGVESAAESQSSSTDSLDQKRKMAEAMAAAEDEEDVMARKGLENEISKELVEFDENVAIPVNEEEQAATISNIQEKPSQADLDEEKAEKDFQSWQVSVGPDFNVLKSSLKPIERYALHVKTDVDPYYSIHFLTEHQKLEAMGQSNAENSLWDLDEIEREKELEENRMLAEGELLCTEVNVNHKSNSKRSRSDLSDIAHWYTSERSKMRYNRRQRILKGDGWTYVVDEVTKVPFWYNNDTGEASYSKPSIIEKREEMEEAMKRKFNAFPYSLLLHVLSFLDIFPDRISASIVCKRWNQAFYDKSFIYHVLPVETGVRDSVDRISKLATNEFPSIQAALKVAKKGQVIKLCSGHYWEDGCVISKSIKIFSDATDYTRCIIELGSGSLSIGSGCSVYISDVMIRRPGKLKVPSHCIEITSGVCSIYSSLIDNDLSNGGSTIMCKENGKLHLLNTIVRGGNVAGVSLWNSSFTCAYSSITDSGNGILAVSSYLNIRDSTFTKNARAGLFSMDNLFCKLSFCEFSKNFTSIKCEGYDTEHADCEITGNSAEIFGCIGVINSKTSNDSISDMDVDE